ncbi:unnamed protein product [Rodentolepis nana]|uniref:Uncharacterized protein n=1 Tax=Rodentolepis nana TaxID=102285 RepID=A0A0R3SZT8_RODNA|nr:unnamed protein product [Rodentolepis nana]
MRPKREVPCTISKRIAPRAQTSVFNRIFDSCPGTTSGACPLSTLISCSGLI